MDTIKKYAYQIDSLRFIAMLSIFCNHCSFLKKNETAAAFYEQYFHYGGIGVEFFILLSGFMAGYTFSQSTPTLHYIKKKIFRLFPVHWICILPFMPFVFSGNENIGMKILSLLSSITLLQSMSNYTWKFFNGASWTISTLWLMYLITPYMMKKLINIETKVLVRALMLSLIIGFLINFMFFSNNSWFFYISPFYRIVTYTQGLVLACIIPKVCRYYEAMSFTRKSLFEFVIITAFIFELLVVSPYSHDGYNYTIIMLLTIAIFFVGGGRLFCFSVKQDTCKNIQNQFFLLSCTLLGLYKIHKCIYESTKHITDNRESMLYLCSRSNYISYYCGFCI